MPALIAHDILLTTETEAGASPPSTEFLTPCGSCTSSPNMLVVDNRNDLKWKLTLAPEFVAKCYQIHKPETSVRGLPGR